MLKEIANITEEHGIEVRVRLGEIVVVIRNGNISFNGVGSANGQNWVKKVLENEGGVLDHLKDKAVRKANCVSYEGGCDYCGGC